MAQFPLRLGEVVIHRVEEAGFPMPPAFLLKPEATVLKERATGPVAKPKPKPRSDHCGSGALRLCGCAAMQLCGSVALRLAGSACGSAALRLCGSEDVKAMVAQVQAVEWLHPHYVDERGNLKLVFQMYIIDTPGGKRIAVDTCGGNDKNRGGNPLAHMQSRPFLDSMRSAGCPPETIDYVLCTHLHWDHVGFNTTLREGVWVPTFPNARYLFAKKEMDNFAAASVEDPKESELMRDSVQPIIDAGLHMLVDSDHVLIDEPGCHIRLTPTEGHTLGHVSVVVESAGHNALVTGDCIHHPVQLAHPGIGVWPDADSPGAADTRHRLLAEAVEQRTVIVGTHFSQPSAGFVERDSSSSSPAAYRLRPLGSGVPKM